ncbi:MAG: GAF domain-containing protein [Roseiflexaceae bacterium]|nr:GAF domain-containing protein [Roseiflexaceae bacterium]
MSFETDQVTHQADDAGRQERIAGELLRLAAKLATERSPHEFYSLLTSELVRLLSTVNVAALWLHNAQQGGLQIVALHGLPLDSQVDAIEQIRLRPGEGLVGMAAQREEPLWIEGRARYRELAGAFSQRNQEGLRQLFEALPRDLTAVLVPLRLSGEIVGVLELLSWIDQNAIAEADLPHLQLFANLIASNLRSLQFQAQMQVNQRRLETFSAISTAVSSASDLNELVDNTLDVLLGVVDASAGMLLLYNPARISLTLGAQRRLPTAYAERHGEIAVADAACADAVRYGQPISRPLLPDEQELLVAGLSSCIYLPLLVGGTVAGVACMYSDTPLYERIDTRALMMMASLVGFAIANVKLYTYSEIERQRLSAVVAGIAEGVALCDGEGRLILANETAMNLLSISHVPYGQQLSEMPDFYVFRRLDGEPLLVGDLPLARALAGEVFHDYRVLLRGASGRDTVMSFSGGPVNHEDYSQGAVVVFRDVTASQKAERAKDDFLAVAAHELRSPLAAVRSYTDLLVRREQKRDEDSPDLRGLTILAQQVTHMLRMVDNLLDVSRLDADQINLQVQPVNLVALIQQVIEQQRPAAGDRALEFDGQQQELVIGCDPLRIRQVLTNLIGNAIRYSANDTEICVSLSLERAGELEARHADFASARGAESPLDAGDELALIAVDDQGTGISEEQRATMFRRFARGRERRGEGLGLGLYLSRAFVQRHGGAIWLESQVGSGSTFYVALLLTPPA